MAGARTKSTKRQPKNADDAKYKAPALDKGLDILELFANEDGPIGLSEAARRLDKTLSEIFRMVNTLERRGYLKHDPNTNLYHLTMKLFRLAHRHMPIQQLTTSSVIPMRRFARETLQSVHLVVPYISSALIIAQEDSPTNRGFRVRLGAEISLTGTCSGKILLAFASEEEREGMLTGESTIAEGVNEKSLDEAAIKKIRKQGYYQEKSGYTYGVTDISFPIYGHGGEVKAAITTPFLARLDRSQVSVTKVRGILMETSREISEKLGYDDWDNGN